MAGFPAALREGTEITLLRAPLAPGLVLAFGRWRGDLIPISRLATGKGADEAAAIAGCLGEMAENLSIGVAAHADAVPVRFGLTEEAGSDARVKDLSNPDDLGSEGCACHADPVEARLRAMFERLERAALALWWQGRVSARSMTLSAELVGQYRQGFGGRRTQAWRIDPVDGICAVLVVSEDLDGGRWVIGTAADASPGLATESALREVLLAEVALIAPPDHPDHRRALAFDAAFAPRRDALDKAPLAIGDMEILPRDEPVIVARCADAGHRLAMADLTHPTLRLPVFRCVCRSLPSWRALSH